MISHEQTVVATQPSHGEARPAEVPVAVQLDEVSKVYRLYGSPREQVLDSLGFNRLLFRKGRIAYREFHALRNISLTVRHGERVGIIGRNGAGKTTLLKLITRNFAPTTGAVEVNGSVQALMQMGLGFHPEFSGYENIRSSLLYNGLAGAEFEEALADVIDFVELGEFLHQPMKTYSLGMGARVQFAAATAIKPDILIIDEVLGAGDAYFSAKSADRMEKLVSSGCTLFLVSHSMQQVLQFCERALWLEEGRIVLEGESLEVVKAYEEFSQRLRRESERRAAAAAPGAPAATGRAALDSRWLREKILRQVLGSATGQPGEDVVEGPASAGGISRWEGEGGLRIAALRVLDDRGEQMSTVRTGDPVNIEIEILAQEGGDYVCSYVLLLFTEDGRWVSRHCSDPERFVLPRGGRRRVRLRYPQTLLGNGKYVFSAAIYRELDLDNLPTARYYDLLARSFEFEVKSRYPADLSLLHHPCEWVVVE